MTKIYKTIFFVIGLLVVLSCTSKNNDLKEVKYEGIARTLHLLNTSNQINRNEVHILFYGQSIIGGLKSDILIDSLKKRFPFANIKHKNKAIGGFTLPSLIKTAEHDLYIENPDLIIFHGYDGIKDSLFDALIHNVRSRLNSDILLFDHHYVWDKPESRLDGVNKSHDSDSDAIKEIAKKYNCGFVNVREQWKNHLDSNKIEPNELMGNTIAPNVHPNDKGNVLLRSILLSVFEKNRIENYNIENDALRDEIYLENNSKEFKIICLANRLSLETNRRYNKGAKVELLINKKKPSEIQSNYTITRPSKGYQTWMPAVKMVSFGSIFPKEEEWKIKIFEIDRTKIAFKHTLTGSLTGFDGEGNSQSNFTSNSGRVLINKADWNIFEIEKITKVPTPENFEINFNVTLLVKDILELERRTSKYLLFRNNNIEKVDLKLKIIEGSPELKKIQVSRPYIDNLIF
ncbi:SGNH/GDSL hydrolase family protein [Flavivirga jejuensis]|uniref:SGNH/GDSL hydrolase family protein n=1 Tax=Flavivirga jejuensis TaxID=870487 RepID=A0ABT8WQB5_9FLAO|nr:SGNH/GDSL hydrolase family protein [Flavivirga jejuensis]MDO5975345.1 SGNH/GDSL hydrolase family protein [Flavivirga jejuensis]